jgi:hypothetical protein
MSIVGCSLRAGDGSVRHLNQPMTALVFSLEPDQVCIAMDTLVIDAQDRMPLSFQRKFLSVPQSDLIIAGTGHVGCINGWFDHYQTQFLGASIDELDQMAPELFNASVTAEGGLSGVTTTIYHFGYSLLDRCYVGYAYRSERQFRSDRLSYGLGIKPVIPIAPTDDIQFPEFFIRIIEAQQSQDNHLRLSERVGIGGEIEFAVMAKGGIRVSNVLRFSSYEAELSHIEQRADS